MTIDLIKEFGIEPCPPLKKFYMDRHISDKKIADWLGVSSMTIGRWLKGTIPNKYKSQMEELQQEILDWEKINGQVFNAGSVLIDNTDPAWYLVCPYDDGKVDIKFGLYFDCYHECCEKDCNLFKECKAWTIAHSKEYAQSMEKWKKKNTIDQQKG